MHLWMNYSFNYNITPRPPHPTHRLFWCEFSRHHSAACSAGRRLSGWLSFTSLMALGEKRKKNKNLSATLVRAAKLLSRLPDGSSVSSSSQTGPRDHKQWQSDRKVSQFTVRVAIPDKGGCWWRRISSFKCETMIRKAKLKQRKVRAFKSGVVSLHWSKVLLLRGQSIKGAAGCLRQRVLWQHLKGCHEFISFRHLKAKWKNGWKVVFSSAFVRDQVQDIRF